MTELKLKPCPFCGGEAELTFTNDNNHMPFVRCKYGSIENPPCYACQYPWNHKTVKDAVESWNRRSDITIDMIDVQKVNDYVALHKYGYDSLKEIIETTRNAIGIGMDDDWVKAILWCLEDYQQLRKDIATWEVR